MELSEIPQADHARMGRTIDSTLRLGGRVLPGAARGEREVAPCSRAVAGLQMDSHCLPLLAGPDTYTTIPGTKRSSEATKRRPPPNRISHRSLRCRPSGFPVEVSKKSL